MTIPASNIVSVLPGVEGATGQDLVLNGLALTKNLRVPTGTVMSFNNAPAVGAYFGLTSVEYAQAQIYFNGFTTRTQIPESMLFARWTPCPTKGRVLGGVFDTLTLSQIQGIVSGGLSIVMDGYTYSVASLNLSSATSYTSAASLIQTALNGTLPAGGVSASSGGAIAPVTSTFTGSISGNVLTVTSAPSNVLVPGTILTGTGVTTGTMIGAQLSGTTGGIGTYAVLVPGSSPEGNDIQLVASTSMTGTYGVLTLTGSNASGTFSVGQTLTGSSVTAGTQITGLGTGTGAAGTYYVSPSGTTAATTITGTGSALSVTFDSTSGGLFIASGALFGGAFSTAAFATGTNAAGLFLTAQTGAVLSQGAAAQTPNTFMSTLVLSFQNWASFWTLIDPDGGATNGPGQKLLFSAWTSAQNNRYGYLGWDTDTTPTTSNPATTCFAYQVNNIFNYSGTMCIYDPGNIGLAAFEAGSLASVNFGVQGGRTTMAFRSQPGLVAAVTQNSVYNNLKGNGYNFYGTYATANQQFTFFYPGSISGPFLWADSFFNQVYMNASFQLDLMEFLIQANSVPYNSTGAAGIEQACLSTITQMVNFGAIRTGVTLSSLEVDEVNGQAGYAIDGILFNQGWYFQVQQASPSVRQARGSPPIFFWYVDGQSVQSILLNSIELL